MLSTTGDLWSRVICESRLLIKESGREALDDAGGNWRSPGKGLRPVRFETNPYFRWSGYSLKNTHRARPARRRYMRQLGISVSKNWLAGFEGKAVTASEALKREAIGLHAAAVLGR